jgi:hypothetical protein
MSTAPQNPAYLQIAKKSTGPKTAEGKAAVSQNAVKHGLFAESLITGEDPDEYQAFHDNMLADVAPAGAMETMLAERIISLWWRLRRAERMQNEALEDMIEDQVTNPWAVSRRRDHCYNEGLKPGDPRFEPEHLALGRVASGDWAACRILDKMLLYERRIESSLNRAMNEFRRFQTIRRNEHQELVKRQSARDEAIAKRGTDLKSGENTAGACPEPAEGMAMPRENHGDLKKQSQFNRSAFGVPRSELDELKKQSQFAEAEPDASPYAEDGYGDNPAGEAGENKAERTQFQAPRPPSRAGATP